MAANKLPPLSVNTFWKIKPGALIADLILIGISIFLSHSLSDYVANMKQQTSVGLQILIIAAQFTVPWYLGYLYGRYFVFYDGFMVGLIRVVSILVFVAFVGSVGFFLSGLPKSGGMMSGKDNYILFSSFWITAVIASPFLALSGKSAGKGSFARSDDTDNSRSFFELVSFCLAIIIPFFGAGLFIYYLEMVPGIICSAGTLLLFIFRNKIYEKIKDMYAIKLVESIATQIFPFIVLLSLILWSFVSVQTATVNNPGSRLAFAHILYILTLNGFIPLRIIQMFEPPLSILNLVLSIASLVIFLSLVH